MQPHARVAWQVLDGQAVLVDLDAARALGLNDSASFLWQRLDGRGADELARDLCDAFDVSPEQARRDVHDFLDLLRSRGFVAS